MGSRGLAELLLGGHCAARGRGVASALAGAESSAGSCGDPVRLVVIGRGVITPARRHVSRSHRGVERDLHPGHNQPFP
jgi:hypothetical protein